MSTEQQPPQAAPKPPAAPTPDKTELEKEKIQVEIEKLKKELGDLSKPWKNWYKKPQILIAIAQALLPTGVALLSVYILINNLKYDSKKEDLERQKSILTLEAKELAFNNLKFKDTVAIINQKRGELKKIEDSLKYYRQNERRMKEQVDSINGELDQVLAPIEKSLHGQEPGRQQIDKLRNLMLNMQTKISVYEVSMDAANLRYRQLYDSVYQIKHNY